jgi:hypothetical protein
MSEPSETGSSIPDFKPRSRAPVLVPGVIGLVLGGIIGAAAMTQLKPSKPEPKPARAPTSACPSVSSSAAPAASASAAPPIPGFSKNPLAARAAEGDREAIRELESRPAEQRSAVEVVALSRAKAADKRKAISELGHRIQLVPKLLEDPATNKSLRQYGADAEVAVDVVLALTELPGPGGPDALYRLGPGSYPKNEASLLAEQVLYARDVYSKASPALQVLLDLKREEDCQKVAKLLDKVRIHGDKRVLVQLGRLQKKTGCGAQKRDDCWACLRKPDLIKEAAKDAAKRKAP